MKRVWGTVLLTLALSSAALAQSPVPVGDWHVLPQIDPFTDENSSIAAVMPDEYPTGGRNDGIAIMCSNASSATDGINLMAAGSAYIGEQFTTVTYRVDSHPPVTARWFVSNTNVLAHNAEVSRSFISALLGGEKLAIRWDAYRTTPTYIYSIRGLREALIELGCYTGQL